MLKRKRLVALLFIAALTVLGGCSDKDSGHNHMQATADMSMVPIQVELDWTPEQVKVNEQVTFKAVVTQDGGLVDDAKEVLFEIVNEADAAVKYELKGTSAGNGTYEATGSVEQAGTYTVTSHVTARTMHSMPSKELNVLP